MKLDLTVFFKLIEDQPYVVIKPSDRLPDYSIGSDVDIFCYNPIKIAEIITDFLSDYINSNSEINIVDSTEKMHIDFMVNNKINFRFDLYKNLPSYKNILLKSSFYSSVIEGAVNTNFTSKSESKDLIINTPSVEDDFILRYVEYHEYYAQRPDKIKHIEYIESKIPKDKKGLALDKLHFYTCLPENDYIKITSTIKLKNRLNYYLELISRVTFHYKKLGTKAFVLKVFKKVTKT